jgi:hypothetical protein
MGAILMPRGHTRCTRKLVDIPADQDGWRNVVDLGRTLQTHAIAFSVLTFINPEPGFYRIAVYIRDLARAKKALKEAPDAQ